MATTREQQRLRLWRVEVQSGLGGEAGDQPGVVLHPLEAGLDQCGDLVDGAFGEVGQAGLQM